MNIFNSSKFQFHKVRLKEAHAKDLLDINTFQFHKVRLKVPEVVGVMVNVTVSIP